MSKSDFYQLLSDEVSRIDALGTSKRHEKIITGFSAGSPPRAVIDGRKYLVFNSNDYLGLRLHPALSRAERSAAHVYGSGPGAVRFISGSLQVHRDLEQALAMFHHRQDAMIFSSAFAANLAVISSLIKGQSKDSLLTGSQALVLSDELNHRSIVDGIRVAGLPEGSRQIFPHFDLDALIRLLQTNQGKFSRVVVITDGVFSMLGEYQDLARLTAIISEYDHLYPQGIFLIVDDCHGIGVLGPGGRGVEELGEVQSDILVGTLGKAFGVDGGYVVGDHQVIDYLRESAATYIYSNPISPGAAAAALASVYLLDHPQGASLLHSLSTNIALFKGLSSAAHISLAADSHHAIQPVLLGDTRAALSLQSHLLKLGILTTAITYPVVPRGRDEIRIQLSANHTDKNIEFLVDAISKFKL